jgi:hypothetical protein
MNLVASTARGLKAAYVSACACPRSGIGDQLRACWLHKNVDAFASRGAAFWSPAANGAPTRFDVLSLMFELKLNGQKVCGEPALVGVKLGPTTYGPCFERVRLEA